MTTADVSAVIYEGDDISFEPTADVVGKRFIALSGIDGDLGIAAGNSAMIKGAHCGAGLRPDGVSKYTAANATECGLHGKKGRIVQVNVGADVTDGQVVEVGANGKAIPLASGIAAGKAVKGATNGNDAWVRLY